VAEDHATAAGGDLGDGGAAAFGEDFGAEVLEIEDSDAEIAVESAGAGELAFENESGLARDDPVEGGAEWMLADGFDDFVETVLGFAGTGGTDDELDGHNLLEKTRIKQ
jgi:hypothetical protein